MPNIEIHGTHKSFAADLGLRISGVLEGTKYYHDVVLSIMGDSVTDLRGKPKAFLRVIFAGNEPSGIHDDCMERLTALNMDMEIVMISEFIPTKP